ncbi:MAG: biotin attachment protein, partial [Epsilonproteobacteria bacterium]|nr:biotin attachment protein [Campylobacterota bacterium]
GGYGTSVTPVSQFYFQQAFNNVMFGPWKKIAEGYGKMVLGYFGKTPVAPDSEVVSLASEQLKLPPTTKNALDLADADDTKSLLHVKQILEKENLDVSEENLLIAAACKEKGIAFLKGEAKVNVRKVSAKKEESVSSQSDFTVTVNGQKYHVKSENNSASIMVNGENYEIDITEGFEEGSVSSSVSSKGASSGVEIKAGLPGSIFKVLVNVGDKVTEGQVVVIIEAMKMEIEVTAPSAGVVSAVKVKQGDTIVNGQVLVML